MYYKHASHCPESDTDTNRQDSNGISRDTGLHIQHSVYVLELVKGLTFFCCPPDDREFAEITSLRTNIDIITESVSGTLQWFANKLIEKAFITQEPAQGILRKQGVTAVSQANELISGVFTKVRDSDRENREHWFYAFVDIFSHDRTYEVIMNKLKTSSTGKP